MELPKLLMIVGGTMLLIGFFWSFLGKIPGDFIFKRGNITVYFPVVTSVILSIIISVILFLVGKWK